MFVVIDCFIFILIIYLSFCYTAHRLIKIPSWLNLDKLKHKNIKKYQSTPPLGLPLLGNRHEDVLEDVSVDMIILLVDMRTCKNMFFTLLYSIHFKHICNKNIYLKHFKHTIKYNMSSLNVLESSKSSESTMTNFQNHPANCTYKRNVPNVICTVWSLIWRWSMPIHPM